MSASYEQRLEIVMHALMDIAPFSAQKAEGWAEKILDALDHLPETVDWVCQGQPRDPVKKGAA